MVCSHYQQHHQSATTSTTLKISKKAGCDINIDGVTNMDDLLLITYEEIMYNIVKPYYLLSAYTACKFLLPIQATDSTYIL